MFKVGNFIGAGAFGVVFQLTTNKVVKFECISDKNIPALLALMGWILAEQPSYIVKIYDFGLVSKKSLPKKVQKRLEDALGESGFAEGSTILYTVMEELRYKDMADETFTEFMNEVEHVHPIYVDCHGENVMFDKDGNPKLIDLGGFFDASGMDVPDRWVNDCDHSPGLRSEFKSLLREASSISDVPKGLFIRTTQYVDEDSPDEYRMDVIREHQTEDNRFFDTPEEFYAKRRGKDWMDYYLEYLDSKS